MIQGQSVALMVISDGRDEYLQRTLLSAVQHLPSFDQLVHVNDRDHELGFAGAIQAGWDQIDTDYVFHLEADFTIDRRVPLDRMLEALRADRGLTQIALLRQPWNEQEIAAGGIVELDPAAYKRRSAPSSPHRYLEHRKFWTTNPSLYPRWIVDRGWPQRPNSEGHFGLELFAERAHWRSAFWGTGDPWVTHIGTERAGVGY